MAFKKPDPYKTDNATAPLNDEELARARPAKEVLDELGLDYAPSAWTPAA